MAKKKVYFMRTFVTIALLLLVGGIVLAWQPVQAVYFKGVPDELENPYVHIPNGSTFEDLVGILYGGEYIDDVSSFRWVAEQMKFTDRVRPGRYEIQPGWNNRELIQHLRAGKQAPVNVVLNNERLLEEVAGKVATFIEADSLELINTFYDQAFLNELGFQPETLMSLFIPNTYEFYWNTTAKGFVERMLTEHLNFWNKDNRLAKAEALGMTTDQVYTLASIVERETNANIEKPTIAGVYLNRLAIDMRLQADPTCVFATRDFTTHRVTEYHLKYDSPYNTYLYKGLPPGPISMASISSIDAVLNREKHDYIYFCAKGDNSGTHAFAVTFAGHNVNVAKLRKFQRERDRAARD
jgi:UPF0755 protein